MELTYWQAIHRSEVCRTRTKLIVFLGTPHRGSSSAGGWGDIAANIAALTLQDTNKRIVKTLEVDSEILNNIHEQFQATVREFGIRIHSFQETQRISGMKGLQNKVSYQIVLRVYLQYLLDIKWQVVDDFSSRLDLQPFETVESIDADHMHMARCIDKTDEQYRKIAGVLKLFMRKEVPTGDKALSQVSVPIAPLEAQSAPKAIKPDKATKRQCWVGLTVLSCSC
jgi:hypothetical protein